MDFVLVDMLHNSFPERRWIDIRIPRECTEDRLKILLEKNFGYISRNATIQINIDSNWTYISPTSSPINIKDGSILLITDPENKISSEVIERYTISEEDYCNRPDNARKFLERLGRVKKLSKYTSLEETKKLFPIGSRCSVYPGDQRGVISFVGRIANLAIKIGNLS